MKFCNHNTLFPVIIDHKITNLKIIDHKVVTQEIQEPPRKKTQTHTAN